MPHLTLMKRRRPERTTNQKMLHKWYNVSKWRKMRNAYVRDNPLCQSCLAEDRTTAVAEVHHITPIDPYHPDPDLIYDYDNLVGLCAECHHKIHDKLKQEAHDAYMKQK